MRVLILLAFGLSLSACNSGEADPVIADNASWNNIASDEPLSGPDADQSARLPGSEYVLEKPLTKLAKIAYVGLPLSRRYDSFTGGEAVHGVYENGMLDFFTMPDGGLWKVRLTSGIGDNCARSLSTAGEVTDFIKLVTPAVDAGKIAPKLASAIRAGRVEQVVVGSLRFSASGECRHTIGVTEMNALPPDKRS